MDRPFAELAPPNCTEVHCRGADGFTVVFGGVWAKSSDQEPELLLLDLVLLAEVRSSSSSNSSRILN